MRGTIRIIDQRLKLGIVEDSKGKTYFFSTEKLFRHADAGVLVVFRVDYLEDALVAYDLARDDREDDD